MRSFLILPIFADAVGLSEYDCHKNRWSCFRRILSTLVWAVLGLILIAVLGTSHGQKTPRADSTGGVKIVG
jgi:hypothetical protein